MPLVRIDVIEGRTPEALRAVADTVQEVLQDVFAAPPGDRYQIVTQHPAGQIICEDTGLRIPRTDDLVVLQILQQGRDQQQKQALYRALAERLEQRCGLAPSDLIVAVSGNGRDDWSFGLGRAQFVEGDL